MPVVRGAGSLIRVVGHIRTTTNYNTMKLKHLVAIAGLFLCLGSLRAQESSTIDSPGRFMTTFGEFSPAGSPWTVRVADTDPKLQISYHYQADATSSGTSTVSPSDWKAQSGWFVFVENNERVWAYDGARNLFLQVSIASKLGPKGTSYGPSHFPCPVPSEVLTRLTPEARKAIKSNKI
jgi:hypothetical protein